jgi:hypothetical protein
MTRNKLQLQVIGSLRSAGASEEIIALVQSCFGSCTKPGRPRKYPSRAAIAVTACRLFKHLFGSRPKRDRTPPEAAKNGEYVIKDIITHWGRGNLIRASSEFAHGTGGEADDSQGDWGL